MIHPDIDEVIPEAKHEETPMKLPAWITNPFSFKSDEKENDNQCGSDDRFVSQTPLTPTNYATG